MPNGAAARGHLAPASTAALGALPALQRFSGNQFTSADVQSQLAGLQLESLELAVKADAAPLPAPLRARRLVLNVWGVPASSSMGQSWFDWGGLRQLEVRVFNSSAVGCVRSCWCRRCRAAPACAPCHCPWKETLR